MTEPTVLTGESNARPIVGMGATGLAIALFLVGAILLAVPAEEDAFIYYRYALQFARGEGLVFQAGEPVEGFSGFLWMWLLAIAATVGCDLPTIGPLLGLAAGVALILTTRRLAQVVGLGGGAGSVAVLAIASCHAVMWWARSGLETLCYATFVTGFVARYLALGAGASRRDRLLAGVWLAAVVLSRPEGLLLVGIVALDLAWRRALSREVALLLPWALAQLGLWFWRWSVYGSLVPNTGVKVDPLNVSRSVPQVAGYLASVGFVPFAMPLWYLVTRRHDTGERRWRVRFLMSAVVLMSLGFTLLAGGDYREHFRFLVPTLPLLVVAFLSAMTRLSLPAVFQKRFGLTAAFVLLSSYSVFEVARNLAGRPAWSGVLNEWRDPTSATDDYHLHLADWLIANADSGLTVAYGQMGKAPYYTLVAGHELQFVDTLGLLDRQFTRTLGLPRKVREVVSEFWNGGSLTAAHDAARRRLHAEYLDYLFGERRPDLIVLEEHFLTTGRPLFRSLIARPEFERDYVLRAEVPSPQRLLFRVYERR
ncbi:MAG: hypothetical protein NXI31_09045 [bacterium]|nr:hypothetical protein [bacterium]